jgi:hypothetical protein
MRKALIICILFFTGIITLNSVPYTTLGQLRVPDAYLLPHKAAEITFTNYLRREENSFTENKDYEYVPMGMLNLGLFDRIGLGGWVGDDIGFVNLKLKVLEETASIPQIAVGIDNLFSPVKEDAARESYSDEEWFDWVDKTFYERNSAYVAVSKASVLRNMTGLKLLETYITLGWGINKFKGQVDIARRFEGIFGSLSIKPHRDLNIILENDGYNINVGAQYSYRNFGFKISYVGLEEQENNKIGIAISYLFDRFADKRRQQAWEIGSGKTGTESDVVKSELDNDYINSNTDLLEELKKLREQREQAQKVLDELRNQLQEMEETEN